eukprot:1151549-Pelagomonas_calceolata.AAC.1
MCLVLNLWPSSAVSLFASMRWVRLSLSGGKRFVTPISMRGYRQSLSLWQTKVFRDGCTGVESAFKTGRMLEALPNFEHMCYRKPVKQATSWTQVSKSTVRETICKWACKKHVGEGVFRAKKLSWFALDQDLVLEEMLCKPVVKAGISFYDSAKLPSLAIMRFDRWFQVLCVSLCKPVKVSQQPISQSLGLEANPGTEFLMIAFAYNDTSGRGRLTCALYGTHT